MVDIRPILIVTGPTGSGKTGVTVRLAERFPIEVVSADSRQIIRHLNIGTAKPTEEECRAAPVHLLDLVEPGDSYSAARFIDDAVRAVRDILGRNRIPVVVGGTGLYLKALTEGVVELEQPDLDLRERLEKEFEELGTEAMWERLNRIDPLEAARSHPNNQARILRALEIYEQTGKTKSELVASGSYKKTDFQFHCLALIPDRAELYERINRRVERMIAAGLLDELNALIASGLRDRVRLSKVIGYAELLDGLDGLLSMEEAVAMIKQNSRRYAKRQMTWLRTQMVCESFSDGDRLYEAAEEFLRREWSHAEKG